MYYDIRKTLPVVAESYLFNNALMELLIIIIFSALGIKMIKDKIHENRKKTLRLVESLIVGAFAGILSGIIISAKNFITLPSQISPVNAIQYLMNICLGASSFLVMLGILLALLWIITKD